MSEALFVEENKVAWCAARTCTKGRGRCYIQVREASVTDNTEGTWHVRYLAIKKNTFFCKLLI